ncbi:MAG: hypothetical protein IPK71_17660 [Myxococcales bacterium]|nr:hypothetical protein [Myxococcales bacterium]
MTTTDVSMPAPQHDEPRPGRDEVSLAREPDTDGAAPRLRGEVELGSAEHRERRAVELLGEGALVVRVPSPTRAERGRLAAYLDDAIEGKLLALGASGPYPGVDDTLGDQLFRARAIGASGIVLSLDPLRAIRSPALTPEDSTTLATLAYATRSRSFVFLLDDDDADAPAYGRPVPLLALLDPRLVATVPAPRPSVPAAPPAIPAQAEEIKAIAEVLASPSPPAAATTDDTLAAATEHDEAPPTVSEPAPVLEAQDQGELRDEPEAARAIEADDEPAVELPTYEPVDRDVTLGHARALADLRGPQPLSVLKTCFLSHYLPLGEILFEARAHGVEVEPRVAAVHSGFRRNFERAYSDAFPTFALTGKRPKMVLDAFEEATRLARASGARSTSLLLVPGLRVDLGRRAHDALLRMLPEDAEVESGLLFAALPTTSARQEDTLARGAAALGSPRPDESLPDAEWHARGALRRVRMGARDLFSLDTIAAFRAAPLARGPRLAFEVATLVDTLAGSIARHAHGLVSGKSPLGPRTPERTLLYVFGDHGFVLHEDGRTQDGGATPEEVIVPYFAYVLDPAN